MGATQVVVELQPLVTPTPLASTVGLSATAGARRQHIHRLTVDVFSSASVK